MTRKQKFTYNKSTSSCQFCNRTRNPHPEFDEPIVTTQLTVNKNEIELCINCYFDCESVANESGHTLVSVIKDKYNLQRLLNKIL